MHTTQKTASTIDQKRDIPRGNTPHDIAIKEMFNMTAGAEALLAASNKNTTFLKPKARSISGTQCTTSASKKH
jgi:hypothetical protein